ncbi:uncharacterized protein [Typha latifolia]|uniref:uncharacterized protein isoform X2 n=1 Tax=Typha latifolia TaxID=4733 RepID=UPI003C309BF3
MLLSSGPAQKPPAPRPRWFPPRSQMTTKVTVSLDSPRVPPLLSSQHSKTTLLSSQSSPPPFPTDLGFRRDPELGLLALLFVLSAKYLINPAGYTSASILVMEVVGSFFSLAIVSLPVMSAFKRLEVSANKLSKVVSEEVPGTLSSLKLSGLEINDLTSQLNSLRQKISGNQYGKKGRRKKPSFRAGRNNSIIN